MISKKQFFLTKLFKNINSIKIRFWLIVFKAFTGVANAEESAHKCKNQIRGIGTKVDIKYQKKGYTQNAPKELRISPN